MQAPHFVMMVRAQLDGLFKPEELFAQGGVVVRTSLDLDWQKAAESALQRQIEALRHSEDGLGHNVNNGALVALDPDNGEILALVGSPDYFDAENGGAINMALSPRQPGSALKPLVYAVAMSPGSHLETNRVSIATSGALVENAQAAPGIWTAATMLLDAHTSFTTHEGKAYTPENYDLRQHGPVLLREALASSLNIPAVLALDHIGLQALADQAGKMGITTLNDPEQYDLSLALGGGAVRLLELTAAYGAFANGGYRINPKVIMDVSDLDGNVLYSTPPANEERVLDERVSWLISDILGDNEARQLGFGQNSILRLDRPAAVKTGTTSNFHDNWTVGYTPDLVVGVWVGNTNYEAMREVTGLSGAAPIWHDFMRTVLRGVPKQEFERPPGLVQIEVCQLSGLLPTESCPYRRYEWFIEGTQPIQSDNFYREVVVDAGNGSLADASTPLERRVTRVVLDLPAQAEPWARSQGLPLYSDLVVAGDNSSPSPLAALPLQLVSPADGSLYRLATGMPSDAQRIRLQAVGEAGLREVSFWVDGALVARLSEAPYEAWWMLQPGFHRVWVEAVRQNGERVTSPEVTFEVIG